MIFVTNFTGYQLLVQRDYTKWVPNPRGSEYPYLEIVVDPQIMAVFKPRGILTYAQRKAALDFFDRREASDDGLPPGPYRFNGVAADDDFAGQTYEASDHWLQFSVFDTEKDCPEIREMDPAEVRRLCEAKLLADSQFGRDYIRVDEETVALPWPDYENTHHKQVATVVRALKLDPLVVAEYEKTRDDPRPGVIADLEALAEQFKAEQAAEEALTIRG